MRPSQLACKNQHAHTTFGVSLFFSEYEGKATGLNSGLLFTRTDFRVSIEQSCQETSECEFYSAIAPIWKFQIFLHGNLKSIQSNSNAMCTTNFDTVCDRNCSVAKLLQIGFFANSKWFHSTAIFIKWSYAQFPKLRCLWAVIWLKPPNWGRSN